MIADRDAPPRYHTRARRRKGVALASVIFALTVIGVLITSVLVVGVEEARLGDNARYSARGFEVAEGGLADVRTTWKQSNFDTLTTGDSVLIGPAASPGGTYEGFVRRLAPQLYLIRMTGTERGLLASRTQARVNQLIRVTSPGIDVKSAVLTQGNVTVTGNTTITGTDSVPNATWSSCPPTNNLAGIRTPDSSAVSINGSGSVTGSPAVQEDSAVNDSSFQVFGGTTYDSLAAGADVTMPGGTYPGIGPVLNGNGSCNIADSLNWGDALNHASACGSYAPVVHFTGSGTTILNGGQGQGVLLVDGNLKLAGGVQFYGIIIVQGTISVTGGSQVTGGVLAEDASLSTDAFSGTSTVHYSSCAVQYALHAARIVRPLVSRSWFAD